MYFRRNAKLVLQFFVIITIVELINFIYSGKNILRSIFYFDFWIQYSILFVAYIVVYFIFVKLSKRE
jgi:hypothetical protein